MSEIYIVWAEDADKAQARLEQITDGETHRVLRRGDFPLIQAEDIDGNQSLVSGGERYCIVFEVG
jgi:hypothetical protein